MGLMADIDIKSEDLMRMIGKVRFAVWALARVMPIFAIIWLQLTCEIMYTFINEYACFFSAAIENSWTTFVPARNENIPLD